MKNSLFTDAERASLIESKKYPSKISHTFADSISWDSRERFGTNANGTKFKK